MHGHRVARPTVAILVSLTAISVVGAQALRQPSASTPGRIQSRTYEFKDTGVDLEYALYVPTTYTRARPAPLIIALHGFGARPMAIMRYQGLTTLAEQRGYIIAAPMGYSPRAGYGSLGNLGRIFSRGGIDREPENLGELSEKDVMNVLDLVRNEFKIDDQRVYLFGHSMGGAGAWHLGIKHADTWAALAPVSPAIYTNPGALEKIKGLPVIVIQGEQDRIVSVHVTRQWVAMMKALGMKYSYIEVPDGDHMGIIARNPANMRKIFDFFDKASRDTN
jgi:polyhydroxybutyrate depolymerase